jgi:dihydropteroate synthase
MGILNVTPPVFFDGGKYNNESDLLNQVGKMISDGATFIDIGAYSSKPSAEFVSENEGRIVPVVQLILKHFPEALLHRYL